MIDWSQLHVPIHLNTFWSQKDPCVVLHEGVYHLFCSVFSPAPIGNRLQLLHVTTTDFVTFSGPIMLWGTGDYGYGSPDICYCDGKWYLTYQSWHPNHPTDQSFAKLHVSVSKDLVNWQHQHLELARNINRRHRAIDPALAFHNGKWYCIFKQWQMPMLAVTDDLLDPDSWQLVGEMPFGEGTENCQFLQVDGKWRLVMSGGDANYQTLGVMRGTGDVDSDWLDWELESMVFPHREVFSIHGKPSSALYIADWRTSHDNWFYGFFHAKQHPDAKMNLDEWLGIARSRDMIHWELPDALHPDVV